MKKRKKILTLELIYCSAIWTAGMSLGYYFNLLEDENSPLAFSPVFLMFFYLLSSKLLSNDKHLIIDAYKKLPIHFLMTYLSLLSFIVLYEVMRDRISTISLDIDFYALLTVISFLLPFSAKLTLNSFKH